MHVCVCVCVCVCIGMFVCMQLCVCVCVCVCVCIHPCLQIHIHTHACIDSHAGTAATVAPMNGIIYACIHMHACVNVFIQSTGVYINSYIISCIYDYYRLYIYIYNRIHDFVHMQALRRPWHRSMGLLTRTASLR